MSDAMSSEKTRLVPKLRFPEFRGAEGWTQTPLGCCLDYQQPTPYLVTDTTYSPAFKTPVLTAGKTFILGYTDEAHGIFSEGLPVIIFDDFTTATQFVDFPFKAKSSAMKILEAKNGIDIKFMYETLQNLSFEVGAHERHWISTFAPMLVSVPKNAEQQKIADCLSSLDELIAAQARKVDALKTHKKGLMQQLFPREGETQPHIRLPEFQNAGEWKERKLGTVCDIQRGKFSHRPRNDPKFFGGPYPFIQTGDVVKSEGGAVIASQSLNEAGLAVSKLFKPPIVLITIAANIGDTGLLQTEGCFTDSVVGLIPQKDVIPVFLELIMRGQKEDLNKVATTGAQKNINNEILREVSVLLPSIPEQQRIADCLTSLDDLITAAAQELETLKTHKKGLMQQLFPSAEMVEA
jgi:type I restriction enzyme, S subunit